MRVLRLDSAVRRARARLPRVDRRAPAQIAVYMAIMVSILMGLAGAGVDYGLIVISSARLQNALDAAALAGARAAVTENGNLAAQEAAGLAAITTSLAANGFVNGQNGLTISSTISKSDPLAAWYDTATVNGTLALPTRFWRVIGFDTTTIQHRAVAAAGGGMVDVMLSLDLSLSMEYSGLMMSPQQNHVAELRDAVEEFIDQMQLSTSSPRGAQVGIARWAGIKCGWYRSDSDRYVDVDRGPGGSEAYHPCSEDKTVLSDLTMDRASLLKIVKNQPSGGSCPAGPDGAITDFACPLVSWRYGPTRYVRVAGTPIPAGTPTTALDFQSGNSGTLSGMNEDLYSATGTRIPNAITAVNNPDTGYYAWANANGGRNGQLDKGYARKILVIFTDGFNQAPPLGVPAGYPNGGPGSWNTEMISRANTLKSGPTADPLDDVEIYVVGFFCTPYSSSTSEGNWCRSEAAHYTDAQGKHPCPSGTLPPSNRRSDLDDLLISLSSSAPGTCTHYFPLSKSNGDSLPLMFRVIAGSIARGRLQ